MSESFLPQEGSGSRQAKVKALQAKSAKCPLSPQPPSSSGRPVTAPRAQLWAPLLFQWSPNPQAQPESCPSHSTLWTPEEQLHAWVPPGTLLSPLMCSTSLSPQAFEIVLLPLYRWGDQALRRLLRGSRTVPNPNTLPPPSLSPSGALWAHKGPNYETRGAPTSHFSSNNASGCSFTQTAGQWRRGARAPTGIRMQPSHCTPTTPQHDPRGRPVTWLRLPGLRTDATEESNLWPTI